MGCLSGARVTPLIRPDFFLIKSESVVETSQGGTLDPALSSDEDISNI